MNRGEKIDQVTLSVIVPTRNRCDALSRTITTLFEQTATDFEIVVSDNGSTDETAKTLQNLKARSPVPFRCLSEDKPGPAAARNSAVAASAGQILLLMGDDTEPADHHLIQRHIDLHMAQEDPSYAVLGRIAWSPRSPVSDFMAWLDSGGPQFHYFEIEAGTVTPLNYFYSSHLSLARSAFDDVGGFDERFPYAAIEDTDLGLRLAERRLRLDYHPEMLVWHDHPTMISTSLNRARRVGQCAVIFNSIWGSQSHERVGEPSRAKLRLARLGAAPLSVLSRTPLPLTLRHRVWSLAHRFRFAQGYASGPPRIG